MPILATDIKFRKSQRLTDNPDGGGRMVQAEVVDGVLNNLFPDIGDEERTTGRAVLRKDFVHVSTPTVDVLKDAIALLLAPPTDPAVNVCMFSTGSYSDERVDARNRIESYTTKGTESRLVLMGTAYLGSRTITVYCMQDAPTPEIGDNFCLSTNAIGYTSNEQYVRVNKIVTRTTQTFYDSLDNAFQRDVIVIELQTPLIYDFFGQEAQRATSAKPPTRIFTTNLSDAASYYGVKPLTEAAVSGSLSVNVGNPFIQLVPSTRAEHPLVDQPAGANRVSMIQSGAVDGLTYTGSGNFTADTFITRSLGTPFLRASVRVAINDGTNLSDDGNGRLTTPGASLWSGLVDYEQGTVSISHSSGGGSRSFTVTATAAGAVLDVGYSDSRKVTVANRAYNWVMQLSPRPAPGTVVVEYRALGKWIRLTDNGKGQLIGRAGDGTGSVNYATGSIVLTCGAMPDVGTWILWSFGTGVIATRRNGDVAIQAPSLEFTLPNGGIKPSTLVLDWTAGGSAVHATDDGVGAIKVGGTTVGSIQYSTGAVQLNLTTFPDGGSTIAYGYTWRALDSNVFNPTASGSGVATFTIPQFPLVGGGMQFSWLTVGTPSNPDIGGGSIAIPMIAIDDGTGNIRLRSVMGRPYNELIGTVDYATGAVNIKVGQITVNDVFRADMAYNTDLEQEIKRYGLTGGTVIDVVANFVNGSAVSVSSSASASTQTAVTGNRALPPAQARLLPSSQDSVVPGSVRFEYRGRTYVDRAGALYYGVDAVSGAGTYAGTIDYSSSVVKIDAWAAGALGSTINVTSLLSRADNAGVSYFDFRTPGAPIQVGAFTVRATTLNGVEITAAADINGDIVTSAMRGKVDWDAGFAQIDFGEYVPAAGNESEPWYNVDNVDGTDVWKPLLVDAGSIRFGTVVFSSIPLSSVVVGLDTTRLPPDGRVLFIKPGMTAAVHHSEEISIASPAAGQVVNFGRTNIYNVEVRDAEGEVIDASWYTLNLAAGTLTFADPLNLSAYTLPAKITHRILERRLVAEVDITGQVTFNASLARDYPEGAMLSSCLRLGEANGSLDVVARVQSFFDQNTWSNVWLDVLSGTPAPGTYNDVDFPVIVTNADAITERWAIVFTNSTSFTVVGETLGQIATGTTATDCAPINPRTGNPYFTLKKEGWGIGWATGNVLRFNQIGAVAPIWYVRTTLSSDPIVDQDMSRTLVIGNVTGVTP